MKQQKIIVFMFMLTAAVLSFFSINNVKASAAEPLEALLYIGTPDNVVESGTITNQQFGIIVSQSGRIYTKLPNQQNDMRIVDTFYKFPYSQNGIYTIYRFSPSTDLNQIIDLDLQITLDTTAPTITLMENGSTVAKNSFVKGNISASVTDNISGIKSFEVGKDGSAFVAYNNEILTDDGVYEFLAIDNIGNQTKATITKDNTVPAVEIFANEAILENNATTNAASIQIQATDNLSGIANISVKLPDSTSFAQYNQATVEFSAAGIYVIYATDKASNMSDIYTVTIDNVPPNISIESGDSQLLDNSFVNVAAIIFKVDKAGTNNYVHRASTKKTTTILNNETFTDEDTYTFYAIDAADNKSEEITVTIDRTAPVGNFYADGLLLVAPFANCQSFCYTASDINPFVVYVLEPSGDSFVLVENSTPFTDEGTYNFFTEDMAGNKSAIQTITIDRVNPVLTLFSENEEKESGTYVNTDNISAVADDDKSGIKAIYAMLPATSSYTVYLQGTKLTLEGTYNFYCEDNAGNISNVKTIHLDKSPPNGTIYVDGSPVEGNSFTNKSFYYCALDNLSGVNYLQIKRPSGSWQPYTEATIITGIDGTYYFRAYDNAANISSESYITLDTASPAITVYAGPSIVADNTLTNADYIKFAAVDDNIQSCFIRQPNETDFVLTASATQYTVSGIYEFYALDKAGNQSATYSITLDKIKPIGVVCVDASPVANDSHTNKQFYYAATDNLSGIERLEVKKPNENWENYISNTEITGIDGTYYFRAYDNVGNISDESKITLDTVSPNVQVLAGGVEKENGSFTNAATLQFLAFDDNLNDCFIKLPSEADFKKVFSGVAYSIEGEYRFYALDKASNQSQVFVITLDRTPPVGTLKAGGLPLDNGTYTNRPFSYNAVDSLSGISKLEIKKPNEAWQEYVSGTEISGTDGIYYFRAYDKINNVSLESFINYDAAAPTVTIYAGEEVKQNNSFSNADFIMFVAEDFGLESCYIKLPNETNFMLTESGAQFGGFGRYEFYALDKAGNQSQTYSITLDIVKPIGSIYVDGKPQDNGSYTNQAFYYLADGGLSGIDYYEIKMPNGEWESYTEGQVISYSSGDGQYKFRSKNNFGNISNESYIVLDTLAPIGSLYADENVISSGSFTNALRTMFVCEDSALASCFVKRPNDDSFEAINSGVLYSAAGKYEFYAMDFAGNTSGIYVVTIDRTPKAITLNNVLHNTTNQDVTLAWEDVDNNAPIIQVVVNDIEVSNGEIIKTINNGFYEIKCLDEAGNLWTTAFIAERVDIQTATSNKEWWEAKDDDGSGYAFETCEKALAFCKEREQALVKAKTWNSTTWDTGYIMDSLDAANAKQGTFYLYKKHDNPSVEVAYFTLERLNAVIKAYSEKGITKHYYWEKSPAIAYAGNDLYSLNGEGKIIATSLAVRPDLDYTINGVVMSQSSFSIEGKHALVVFDNYKNSYSYDLSIVCSAAALEFKYASGDYYLASNEQPYYLKNHITVRVVDSVDLFAVAVIKNSKNEIVNIVNIDEEFTIAEAGKYVIQTINHSGTKEYVFYISSNPPVIAVNENMITKRLEVAIILSIDKDMSLLDVGIFYSASGEDWTLLESDDYGLSINTTHLKYSFFRSGYYKIKVEDICRSGIDAVVCEVFYEKPEPVGALSGVNENGYSNTSVSFSWSDEAYANLFYNGVETEYSSGTVLTDEGLYKLTFRDLNGYEKEYNFVIDKTAPKPLASEEIANGYAKQNTAITWNNENVIATLYLDNVMAGSYTEGLQLNQNGKYKIELVDLAGNTSVIEFIIDAVAPEINLIGVNNDGKTKSSVKLASLSKEAEIIAYRNGKEINCKVGDTISQVGRYTFILKDEAGNISEYSFEILYSLNASAVFFIVLVIAVAIAATVLIVLMRKKKLFKKKT